MLDRNNVVCFWKFGIKFFSREMGIYLKFWNNFIHFLVMIDIIISCSSWSWGARLDLVTLGRKVGLIFIIILLLISLILQPMILLYFLWVPQKPPCNIQGLDCIIMCILTHNYTKPETSYQISFGKSRNLFFQNYILQMIFFKPNNI